jgi:hypothetical protein
VSVNVCFKALFIGVLRHNQKFFTGFRLSGHSVDLTSDYFKIQILTYEIYYENEWNYITLYFITLRWECNIKTDLKEVDWGGGMDRIDPAQDGQVSGSCEHSSEPSGSIKCGGFLD